MSAEGIGSVVRSACLNDGTEVLLRPIRPQDEPAWKEMLASCSPETIFARFRAVFDGDREDVATRYCFLDDEREMAVVAEIGEDGGRHLVGVGRLVADPDHETAEFAVLVIDAWQNRGLGGVLTDHCCEIAGRWGLERVIAVTDVTNERMIAVFKSRGFALREGADGLVEVAKELEAPALPAPG